MSGLPRFRVWDELNADEEDAKQIEALGPREAALLYAERDSSGLCDGLYTDDGGNALGCPSRGQPISVRDSAGAVHRFRVGIVEFEPRFSAVDAPSEGGAQC